MLELVTLLELDQVIIEVELFADVLVALLCNHAATAVLLTVLV